MSDQKVTGEFSKVRKLISVLEECNGNSKIGGSEALMHASKLSQMLQVLILAEVGNTQWNSLPQPLQREMRNKKR